MLSLLNPDPQEVDQHFMQIALREAHKAFEAKEVPIGCVIVHNNHVIAKAHNQVEQLKDATAHAEMIAITQASSALDSWRLQECTVYTTLEPCPMCAGALHLARVGKIVYAAKDPKKGACGSLFNIVQDERLNHFITLQQGPCEEESGSLLQEFFMRLRNKN